MIQNGCEAVVFIETRQSARGDLYTFSAHVDTMTRQSGSNLESFVQPGIEASKNNTHLFSDRYICFTGFQKDSSAFYKLRDGLKVYLEPASFLYVLSL